MNCNQNYDEYTEQIKDLYNNAEEIWPSNDKCHLYAKSIIEKKLFQWLHSNASSYILHAGSGGTEYDIKGNVCHLDIADKKICNKKDFIVGSIENIPVQNEVFDYVICVGSVINYVKNISKALNELSRVLKPNGSMILEYERSNSAELLFNKSHGADCFYKIYDYNNAEHGIWLYSDHLINTFMKANSMKLQKQYRFHTLSAVAERFCWKERTQLFLTKFDKILFPISYGLAHNRIGLWKKLLP